MGEMDGRRKKAHAGELDKRVKTNKQTKNNKSINFVKYLYCAKYYGYKICFYNSEIE